MVLSLGTLVSSDEHGICTIVSYRRVGHQYDRYFEYDLLTPGGKIITLDEYNRRMNVVSKGPGEK